MRPEYETHWERAERWNGRFAMIGVVAAIGAFVVSGSIW